MSRLAERWGVPFPVAPLLAAMVAMVWSGIVPIVTSLSTVAYYLAYVIPIILAFRARAKWAGMALWTLGKWGPLVNLMAIFYGVVACVILVMPPNELAGKTLTGVLAGLVIIYFAGVRKLFRGPEWAEHP